MFIALLPKSSPAPKERNVARCYREAVASQSPGLLQPWVRKGNHFQPGTGCISKRNRVAVVGSFHLSPRVAEAATLGSDPQPLCGKEVQS